MDHPDVAGSTVLERWRSAAARLDLDAVAIDSGALLLSADLDLELGARLLGSHAERVALRRTDVLRALEPRHGRDAVIGALATLEARGIAGPFAGYAGPWLMAELDLARSVRQFCMGATRPVVPGSRYVALPRILELLDRIVNACRVHPRAHLVVLRGRRGSGRDALLGELVRRLGVEPLMKTVFELRQPPDLLEPELSGAAAVWDARRADVAPEDYDIARRWLRRSTTVAIAVLDAHHDSPDVDGRLILRLDADPQTLEERQLGWALALDSMVRTETSNAMPSAVAVRTARLLAERNQAGVGFAVRAAAHAESDAEATADQMVGRIDAGLHALIQPSTLKGITVERPNMPLERIVASSRVTAALARLMSLCSTHAIASSESRQGVKALFAGPSGTGKTLAARAVASAAGRSLFRIDLASVVSKWIGETEKNLRDALAAAEGAGAVLLFDEGDALFGKRGEVSKGTDRYANMEVAYLLQAIEAYRGIAVVTTNLRSNVDSAFERRFDAIIDFPMPESGERASIWRQELGEAGTALPETFLTQVARHAELSGGNIAAAARLARVFAVARGETLASEQDVQLAVQAEFLKSGSTVRAHHWSRPLPRR